MAAMDAWRGNFLTKSRLIVIVGWLLHGGYKYVQFRFVMQDIDSKLFHNNIAYHQRPIIYLLIT